MLAKVVVGATAMFFMAQPVQSEVTRIVIDTVTSPAFDGESYGDVGQYETIEGRAFGELDPDDPRNTIIQDIELAPRNANGRVEYMATFYLVKPIDMSKSSGLLWQFVPNRGGESRSRPSAAPMAISA